jgi:hypothetical protein
MTRRVRAPQDLLLTVGLAIVVMALTTCASPDACEVTNDGPTKGSTETPKTSGSKTHETTVTETPEASVTETDEPTETLSLTGLPLLLSGWNGTYRKASFSKNGKPVWERPEHWHGSLFPLRIIGVKIWFDGEAWVLHRDGDPETRFMARSSHGGDSPVGDWDGGHVKVSPFRPSKDEDESLPPDRQWR